MRKTVSLMVLWSAAFVQAAAAYEYPLQFTPNPGYRGLVVAGYAFDGDAIVGNCSYYTVHSGSGRGGGYHTITTHFDQTCTWDAHGNLLSVAPGAPSVPAPLYASGSQTVYAVNDSGDVTGSDSALRGGFVNTPSAHYSWVTSNAYTVLQQAPYPFTVTLASDGDVKLRVSAVEVSALYGGATLDSTTCVRKVKVGRTCTVTVTYDPTNLRSATGLAYDTIDISVTSNGGQASDFVQSFTIVLNSQSDDD